MTHALGTTKCKNFGYSKSGLYWVPSSKWGEVLGSFPGSIPRKKEQSITNTKETISQSAYEVQCSQFALEIQQYAYLDAQSPMFKSKDGLLLQYVHKRNQYLE